MNKTTTLIHIGHKRSNKSELHNEVTHYKNKWLLSQNND